MCARMRSGIVCWVKNLNMCAQASEKGRKKRVNNMKKLFPYQVFSLSLIFLYLLDFNFFSPRFALLSLSPLGGIISCLLFPPQFLALRHKSGIILAQAFCSTHSVDIYMWTYTSSADPIRGGKICWLSYVKFFFMISFLSLPFHSFRLVFPVCCSPSCSIHSAMHYNTARKVFIPMSQMIFDSSHRDTRDRGKGEFRREQ